MSLLRSALVQLADTVGVGILGLNRSCWGASTSGASQQSGAAVGLRLLHSFAGLEHGSGVLQPCQSSLTLAGASLGLSGSLGGFANSTLGPISTLSPINPSGVRGYKSNKRSLKPLNTAASWQAVQPLLAEQRQRQQVLGDGDGATHPTTSSPPSRGRTTRWRPRLGPVVDTCLPYIPAVRAPTEYKRVGVITGQYSLQQERVFAIVEVAGTQFKVTTDDILFVNQLSGVEVNDVLALDRVMMLGSRCETVVGRPYVPGATVLVAVEEHFRDGKVHVFKMKKRKRYRKYQAPRPHLTTLRVLQVRGIDPAPGDALALMPELPITPLNARYETLLLQLTGQQQQQQLGGEEGEQEQQQAAADEAAAAGTR